MSQFQYLMYLRKSTDSEDKQALSISAQERELTDLARRRGLAILGEPVRESMSAKRPGRPEFGRVTAALEAGKADGVLVWHLDRLARNPLDGGALMWALGRGAIKQIVTPDRTYTGTADDKLMMSIIFGMATKYSDDLAKNIQRGNREALLQGRWPSRPKLGYMRDQKTKEIIPDPERFPLVKEIWRLRLLGVPTLEILAKARDDWKLTTPIFGRAGGYALAPSQLYKLLRDPFYASVMEYAGVQYTGNHEPMLSWRDFEEVQARMRNGVTHTPRPQAHRFPYAGIITCGSCGALVTAEDKRNRQGHRYTYYHCCRKNRRYRYCPEPSVEVGALDDTIAAFLETLVLPDALVKFAVEKIAEIDAARCEADVEARRRRSEERARVEQRLARIRDAFADGLVSRDDFAMDAERYRNQLRVLNEEDTASRAMSLLEPFRESVSFAQRAVSCFREADPDERRLILTTVSSNLVLTNRTVLIQAKKPYIEYQKLHGISTWCTR